MSGPAPTPGQRLQRLFEAKARAELKTADAVAGPVAVTGGGDPLADVVVVKGDPGAEDLSARRVLAGPDGEAIAKALEALGLDPAAIYAVCSRPRPGIPPETRARRLELTVEAVDPRLVIALDPVAAEDLAAAFGLRSLRPGAPSIERGRVLGALSGLASSLGDTRAKARVWSELKALVGPALEKVGGVPPARRPPKASRDGSHDADAGEA